MNKLTVGPALRAAMTVVLFTLGLSGCNCAGVYVDPPDAGDADGGTCSPGTTEQCGVNLGVCVSGLRACIDGEWTLCAGEVNPGVEACNGLDDNCDGQVDEGCSCTDGATQPCGTDRGECVAGTQTCAGNAWGACVGEVGPVVEACNGVDDNCNGQVDEGCGCVDGTTQSCGSNVGVCRTGNQTCSGGTWGACAGEVGATRELCNGLDDDCDGLLDEGCDDDGDGYCDSAMTVVGTPAICPNSPANTGDDCDDTRAAVHPGVAEVCTDGLDNNCDLKTDLIDQVSCPAISVTINVSQNPVDVAHGRTTTLNATIVPTDAAMAWSRAWAVIDAQPVASCAVADVALSGQTNNPTTTTTIATMPNVLAKQNCVYTIEVLVNGYARDTARVRMVNRTPTLQSISNATFDGTNWRAWVTAGSTPGFTATGFDLDNDTPLLFDWAGADVARLSCNPNCATSDGTAPLTAAVTWAAPATPGTWNLVARLRDGFDPAPTSANLVVEVSTCVWVNTGGTGNGSTPALAMGSIQAALDSAKLAGGTSVCVMGAGTFSENLVVPALPNAPDLLGGFDATGAPSALRPVVAVTIAEGVTFAPGYASTLRHLSFRQSPAAALSAVPAATVTIQDASPELLDCLVYVGTGRPPVGIAILDDGTVAATTAPKIEASDVEGTATTSPDATGIRVTQTPGNVATATIRNSTVNLFGQPCTNACRGIYLQGAFATVGDGNSVNVQAPTQGVGAAIAVDLEGTVAQPISAMVVNNPALTANGAEVSVAVRLAHGNQVTISGNGNVGTPWSTAGTAFTAGIADGMIRRDGTVTRGDSTLLTIQNNRMISGGTNWWAQPCSALGATGEGTDVTVGLFLAGSSSVTVKDNGRAGDQFGAIFGGTSTIHWTPAARRLVPSAVGVWLVDTSDVRLEANEIRSGSYSKQNGCALPSENPTGIGLRDGVPENPAFGGGSPGLLPSKRTQLDRNGINCARPPENGALGAGQITWCVAAELNVPGGATAPVLTNNYLAATRGNVLVALRQRGGAGVVAVNNTFDSDLMLEPFDPPPPPATIFKWPLLLEKLGPAGLTLVNNVIWAHRDDPSDSVPDRVCIKEVVASGTSSSIGTLRNNLFHIEGDNLLVPAAPYVRVTDGTAVANYLSNALNTVLGPAAISRNLAAIPGLTEPSKDWQKSLSRLRPGAAAIDRGQVVGGIVPAYDIDNETRPSAGGLVDIGHDELP